MHLSYITVHLATDWHGQHFNRHLHMYEPQCVIEHHSMSQLRCLRDLSWHPLHMDLNRYGIKCGIRNLQCGWLEPRDLIGMHVLISILVGRVTVFSFYTKVQMHLWPRDWLAFSSPHLPPSWLPRETGYRPFPV